MLNPVALVSGLVCIATGYRSLTARAAWILVGLAFVSWAAGNIYWATLLRDLDNVPIPTWADFGWLGFYPFAYAGLVMLVRRSVLRRQADVWLDGTVAGLAGASVMGVLVLGPILGTITEVTLETIINFTYAGGDLILFGLAMAAAAVAGRSDNRTWLLMVLGFVLFAISDGSYLVQSAGNGFEAGTVVSAGWPAAAWLVALAARRGISGGGDERDGWTRIATGMGFALVALGVLVYSAVRSVSFVGPIMAAGAIVAVLARMVTVFGQSMNLLASSREEALTDPLTGLGNRRSLTREFDHLMNEGAVFSMAILDLDGFKAYNDSLGHSAGDELLATVARQLVQALPPDASVFRLGGDEFCILSQFDHERPPSTESCSELDLGLMPIGASVGACLVPAEAHLMSDAMRLADGRMYDRKQERRNQVSSATDSGSG